MKNLKANIYNSSHRGQALKKMSVVLVKKINDK